MTPKELRSGKGFMKVKDPKMVKKKVVKEKRSVVAFKGQTDLQKKLKPGTKARGGSMSMLEMSSVSDEQRNQYSFYLRKFKDWCKENALSWPLRKAQDETLADFFDVLYLDGKSSHEGEKTVAAMEYHFHYLKNKLPRSRRALRGWRKLVPQKSRIPLPKAVAYGIAMRMMARGLFNMGLMVILTFDAYLRPGEAADLLGKNIVAPIRKAGKQYRFYTLIVRDQDDEKVDKTGTFNNSIVLDNPDNEVWLGKALYKIRVKQGNQVPLFNFKMETFRREFQQAGSWLGLEGLRVYQMRHGGASEDLASKLRDHNAVKDRGRWQTDVSVRRYAKIGKVQSLLAKFHPWALDYCNQCMRLMGTRNLCWVW